MVSVNSSEKVLGLFDISIMTFVSNFGIRWLAVAAGVGPPSLLYWLIGGLVFFLPLVIISSQMATIHPDEGGIYSWTRHRIGEKSGFIVAWLYLVNNIFFYPAALIFLATNFTFYLGKPELANNHWYITISVVVTFWMIVLISLFGVKGSKYIVNVGGILGSILPAVLLVILGFIVYFISNHSATHFSWGGLVPKHGLFNNLSTFTIIMFAMAGIEGIPTLSNSVKNPKRTLRYGLVIGSIMIFALYLLGTIVMNIILTPAEIQKASGLMNVFAAIDIKLHMQWLTGTVAFLLTFAELAAVSIWLIVPVIMFFKCTPEGILPNYFHKTNKFGSPQHAVILIGFIVTAIVIATNLLPDVNNMYQVLILMSTILYFIPYLYLAVVYMKSRKEIKMKNSWIILFGLCILITTILGILFSFSPPTDIKSTGALIGYEAELILGPLFFLWVGWFFISKRMSHIVDKSK